MGVGRGGGAVEVTSGFSFSVRLLELSQQILFGHYKVECVRELKLEIENFILQGL